MSEIAAGAVVSRRAKLGAGVRIGAYAIVGDDVELGETCVVHAHANVQGPSRFGKENIFHPFCSIGGDPQDLKYEGERTELICGDRNTFREYATVSRGTAGGGGVTRIGSDNLFMAYTHIAHDCQIGDHTVFANGANLAGHVSVGDWAGLSAGVLVHQFCRIGRHAYVGASTVVTQDVAPFAKIVTDRETHCLGMNSVGLERRGFAPERIRTLEQAFRLYLRSKLNTTQAIEQMRATLNGSADVEELIRFIEGAERGVIK
jgi:UDP-N-acetylglucosamine acyltransferase